MHSMSEKVWKRKLGVGSEEQPEFDNEFDQMKASRRRLAYSGNYDNDERRCECLESFDRIKCDQRFGFPSYGRLIEEHDGRSQLNDDSWYPRKGYVTERERYSSQFRGSAHYCRNGLFKRGFDEHSESSQFTGYKFFRSCDSGSCRRGSECGQLCQDVYKDSYKRLDDAYLNDLLSDSDRLESCGHEKDWKRAIDKGRDDYQWRSSDLDSSSDMDSDTPPRKRATSTRICKWFLRGHCWRGSSCWHVHDVSGDDFHRGHSPLRPAGRQGGLLSGDDIRVTDRYLFSPLEIKHNSHTTQDSHVSTRMAGDKTEVTGPNAEGHSKSSWKHIPVVSDEVLQRTINCEASEQTESDGWRSWGDTSRNKRLATYDSRHRSGSDNARNLNIGQMGDFDGYASDHKSLKRTERIDLKSNSYFARRRQKIGCRGFAAIDGHEFSDGNSDFDFNSCRRRIKTNGRQGRRFSGKRSEIGNFDGKTPTRNANNASRFKPKRLKKESASDHDHKHLLWKDGSATLCKYFKRGYCKHGNRCWFHHQTVTLRDPVDMDEKKSPTNQTSPSTDVIPVVESTVHDTSMELRSTKNTKRSHQRKAQNSGRSVGLTPAKFTGEHSETTTSYIEAFPGKKSALETDIQDRRPDKGKKLGCNPEGKCEGGHKKSTEVSIGIRIVPETDMQKDLKERRRKNYDYKEDEGDDNQNKSESANLRAQCDVKTTTAQQIVSGKMLAVDPCVIDLKSLDYEMPSVNEEVTEKTSNDHHSPDLIRVPSASLGQYICKTGLSKATSASCNAVMESYPPLKNANQSLVEENSLKTGADLDPQPVSSDMKVGKSQKALSSGFNERLCFERLSTEKLVAMPLERQLELQESCASMGEPEENHNVDQWIGSCQDNKLVINQEGTSNTTGCIETAVGEKALLEADMNDEFVDDKVCDSQELEVDECQKTNSALGYCGVNSSCATTVSADQCGEEMLTRETCPVISIVNTEASFEKQETEEASFDDIGLDMSLEHYIYSSLCLDRYFGNMEDENEATTTSYAFPEDTKAVTTSENPIQQSDGSSAQQTCDGISDTKPILTSGTYHSGLNSGRMTSTEIEEIPNGLDDERHERCTLNEREKTPGVKLEPTNVGNIFAAETSLHVHEELNVILAAESMDRYSDSSCMGRNSETKHTSSWNTSCRGSDFETNISEESGGIPSGPLSERYDIPVSEQEQDETDALRLKGPVASSNVNEKSSSVQDSCNAAGKLSCYDSNDSDSKCEESIEDSHEKAFLKRAVLVLVKEILDPLWNAGRITTKDIYKTIARKSVDKVCGSVQGVSIPRTKDSVDCYLLRNKPKIAQLVLEYVYMHPVKQ
uniref:C3H1-type domain-containing protein n=1 Tax=Kalanchoe fedtschenkoi TaxID=63787 RepID=A0A7N0UBE8_KALFE